MNSPGWYHSAVVYQVLLPAFADANGDGIGDFPGLTARLDHIQWLGATAIWVPPFYPSPMKDGGYDVADYTNVASRYGTLADFDEFVAAAHQRGIAVLIDMVMNHTSSDHQWFQFSRQDPSGPYGDYYVWRDDDDGYPDARIIFTDTESSNWAWDPVREQYYWHRFFSHQPDLNFENPAVQEELLAAVRFWCDRGVDGFRLDAIPNLFEAEGTSCESLPATHEFVARLRKTLDTEYPGVILVAEANQQPTQVVEYFGTDEAPECQICFHFPLMPEIFKALRTNSSCSLRQTIEMTPIPPAEGAWGLFLRNHDELTLEMVSAEDRELMFQWYAPDPAHRANVGIGRRLAPLLQDRIEELQLSHALLLSLPGVPFLYYGDEIAMGDMVELPDRDAVRTPMQWSGDHGAGFSTGQPETFWRPLVTTPGFTPAERNVEKARQQEDSWLNWLRHLIVARSALQPLATGDCSIDHDVPDQLLVIRRKTDVATVSAAFNFGETELLVTDVAGEIRAGTGLWHGDDVLLPPKSFVWLEDVAPASEVEISKSNSGV